MELIIMVLDRMDEKNDPTRHKVSPRQQTNGTRRSRRILSLENKRFAIAVCRLIGIVTCVATQIFLFLCVFQCIYMRSNSHFRDEERAFDGAVDPVVAGSSPVALA